LEVFVYLEGALTIPSSLNQYGTAMRTSLNDLSVLPGQTYYDFVMGTTNFTPAGQPYQIAPWLYPGAEGNLYNSAGNPANGKAGYPSTAVDWVLVSLRDKPDATGITLCQAAALLHKDGRIEFTGNGFSCCNLNTDISYCIVVEHRNHLIIMSDPLAVQNGKIICDFRTKQSYIDNTWGSGFFVGQKEFSPGRFAMFSANGNQTIDASADTDITADDHTWWEQQNGKAGVYLSGDYNLDGDSNMDDRSLWELNNGKFTSVPRN
jgi:hypothetical protein